MAVLMVITDYGHGNDGNDGYLMMMVIMIVG